MSAASSSSATPVLDARIRTASVVVLAMAMSVILFAVVGTAIRPDSPNPAADALLYPLVAAALLTLVASVIIRRISYQPARLLAAHAAGGEPGLADLLLRVTIVSSALGEAVGILGLILGIVSADMYYAYVLCGIALLAVLSNFPRARQWRDLSTEITQRARSGTAGGGFGQGL